MDTATLQSNCWAEAYTLVADAFANVGDLAESVKWRQKAAEQTAKARETQD